MSHLAKAVIFSFALCTGMTNSAFAAGRGGGGHGGGAHSGGSFGDRSGRFPAPNVAGAYNRTVDRVNRDPRLDSPGHGHWPTQRGT